MPLRSGPEAHRRGAGGGEREQGLRERLGVIGDAALGVDGRRRGPRRRAGDAALFGAAGGDAALGAAGGGSSVDRAAGGGGAALGVAGNTSGERSPGAGTTAHSFRTLALLHCISFSGYRALRAADAARRTSGGAGRLSKR